MDQVTGNNTNQHQASSVLSTGVVSTVASSAIIQQGSSQEESSSNITVLSSGGSATTNITISEATTKSTLQQHQQQQQRIPSGSISVSGGSSILGSIGLLTGSVVQSAITTTTSSATSITPGTAAIGASVIQSSATPSPVLSPQRKIFGRNSNGTMIATSAPTNEAELQLYRVLQKASLLAYYDTLLEMGGDDVQQLVDAGEEEFLEIMALVGMASKPLHVRRLQKALNEWVHNPAAFQTPLPNAVFTEGKQLMYSPEPSTSKSKFVISPVFTPTPLISTVPSTHHTPHTSTVLSSLPTTAAITSQVTSSSPQLTPTLTEPQIARLAMGAEKMARQIPQKEPRPQSSKKRTSRELEQVMNMSENDPRRMDEIRKYAAIYGRFDCKRRPEKPLTLHEVCVNEAAAQICKFIPALLTRRDELFPLARQLVKDAGFGHSASIARFATSSMGQQQTHSTADEATESNIIKRTRVSNESTIPSSEYKDLLEESRLNIFAMYQRLGRPFDLSDIAKFSLSRSECDDLDNDSRFSFSNSSSPPLQSNGSEIDLNNREILCDDGKDDVTRLKSPNRPSSITSPPLGVQVISASGGHIIAVANPALAMSPALINESLNIKRETASPSDI